MPTGLPYADLKIYQHTMGYIIPAIGERNMSFEANAFLGKSTFTRPDLQKWLKKACTGTSVYVSVVEKKVFPEISSVRLSTFFYFYINNCIRLID